MKGCELVYESEDSPKGKVWRIIPFADQAGILIEYGALGASLRSVTIPKSKFNGGSIHREIEDRVNAKTKEGYVVVRSDIDPMKSSIRTANGKNTDHRPAVAHIGFATLPAEKRNDLELKIKDHLAFILNRTCHPGTTAIYSAPDSFIIKGQFTYRTRMEPEVIKVPVRVGGTIFSEESTLALVVASLAANFPDVISLADDSRNTMSYRDLAEKVAPSQENLLNQFGIIKVINLCQANQPLGTWFF